MSVLKVGDRVRHISADPRSPAAGVIKSIKRKTATVMLDDNGNGNGHFTITMPLDQLAGTRGGAGRGQGRKAAVEGEPTAPQSIRLTSGQREKLEALGGAAWIRDRIDRAKVKP